MHSSILRLLRGLAAVCALICLTLSLAAHPAHAQAGYYTYTLDNVSFNGFLPNDQSSGTTSGYFDYDPATNQFGDFDLFTSAGTAINGNDFLGNEYDASNAVASANGTPRFEFQLNDGDTLSLFIRPLRRSPGTSRVTQSSEIDTNSSSYNELRDGNQGTVTISPEVAAVPELSPLVTVGLLSALGCGILGVAGVKRRQAAGSVL